VILAQALHLADTASPPINLRRRGFDSIEFTDKGSSPFSSLPRPTLGKNQDFLLVQGDSWIFSLSKAVS
jgi:hypothetical protein